MHPALLPVQRRVFSGMSALMLFAMCLTLFSPCGVPLARAVVNEQAATLVLGQVSRISPQPQWLPRPPA